MNFRAAVVLVVAAGLLGQLAPISAMAVERSVRDIQKALADKGFKPGTPDGIWGKKTAAALRAYQTLNGLPVTGTADQGTIDSLFSPPAPVEPQRSAVVPKSEVDTSPTADPNGVSPVGGPSPSPAVPSIATIPVETPVAPVQMPPARPADSIPTTTEKSARQPTITQPTPSPPSTANQLGTFALVGLIVGGFIMFRNRRKRARKAAEMGRATMLHVNGSVEERVQDEQVFRELTKQTPRAPTAAASQSSDRATSMEAHNRNVIDWIKTNASKAKSPADYRSNDELTEIVERAREAEAAGPVVPLQSSSVLNFQRPKTFEAKSGGPLSNLDSVANRIAGSEWIPSGKSVSIGSVTISGGMFYLGGFLGKQGRLHENENCLINPALTVGRGRDPGGVSMGYWPSYGGISPELCSKCH